MAQKDDLNSFISAKITAFRAPIPRELLGGEQQWLSGI